MIEVQFFIPTGPTLKKICFGRHIIFMTQSEWLEKQNKTKPAWEFQFRLLHCFALSTTFRALLNAIWTWMDNQASRSNNEKAFVSNVVRIIVENGRNAATGSSSRKKICFISVFM